MLPPDEIRNVSPRSSPYLTADEAADYCRVAKQTLYNRRKGIERVPGTRKLLFTVEMLDKWLARRPR
ncbi:MAG TPA: helix-turn-helix domain-containing protein [Fimbriiglobus sp.]|nr:helix-turn-helix domain-containing protein [Fimbriiglobus sp.]